jgi:hypothetical protein
MYQPSYREHPINSNLHYNLIKVTQEVWEALEIPSPEDPTLIRCNDKLLKKEAWSDVQASLVKLKPFLVPNTFIAGGSLFSALFGTHSNDVDLFIYGMDTEQAYRIIQIASKQLKSEIDPAELEAELKAVRPTSEEWGLHRTLADFQPEKLSSELHSSFKQLQTQLQKKVSYYLKLQKKYLKLKAFLEIMRTRNALSFKYLGEEIQYILRLYQTPSEILHGFDVDCCAVGYDGENIWMTQRCLSALVHGYNTFSFKRLSPSYEWRLVKYSTRGMPVNVPGLNSDNFDRSAMEARWQHHLSCAGLDTNPDQRYKEIKGRGLYNYSEAHPENLKGVDILVYMQFHCRKYNYRARMLQTVSRLSKESSDYSPIPFSQSRNQNYNVIGNVLEYLMDEVSRNNYSDKYARYSPYLTAEQQESYEPALELLVNNIPIAPKIYYVCLSNCSNPPEDLELICNLPEALYVGLGIVRPWDLPRQLEFKSTNPGEQMTGTFHRTVLKDISQWYQGTYYHS